VIVTIDNTDTVIVEVGTPGPPGPVGPVGPPGIPFRGVAYRTTAATIDFSGVTIGAYVNSGITGSLDPASSQGIVLPNAGTFGLKRSASDSAWCYVVATADVSASAPKTLGIKIAKNGSIIDATECHASVTNQTVAKLHSMWITQLSQNDILSLWFANFSTQGQISVERARMVIFGVF